MQIAMHDAPDTEPAEELQLQRLASHLHARIDAERCAIAREIHDDVGGTLTALRFDLEWIRRQGGAAVAARVDEALCALDHALAASQRIMKNLRPPVLDAGVVSALGWHVAQFRARTGLVVRFASNRDRIELPDDVAMTVYRVAQESLTNVVKHAGAARVAVDLHEADGLVSLEIADDGRGFGSGDLVKPDSFGLRGLTERARAAGGWLDVSSADGRTTVLLTLPATPAAAERLRADLRVVRTGSRALRGGDADERGA